MGKGIPMKWEKTNYEQIKNNEGEYYTVSPEGDSFIFKCTNYHQNISLADIIFENGDDIWHFYQKEGLSDNPDIIDKYRNDLKNNRFSNDICDVTIEGDIVKLTIKPNIESQRKIVLHVAVLNNGETFNFIQDASQK
ncbi:MAG: hypothetical protein K5874_01265 [Bacteroidaceae bacterium]|nr:hypothetical protein [Bacteroidaceae bacterium]